MKSELHPVCSTAACSLHLFPMNILSRAFALCCLIAASLVSIAPVSAQDLFAAANPSPGGPDATRLLRFPTTNGTQIVFCYAGELYTVGKDGGTARRLTTSATLGRDDVSDRMGPNNIVMAWENTKPLVVFRSRMKSFNDFIGSLFTVGLDAELPQQLPVPRGGFTSFSPDDSKMAFNRVFREFRTWKHYRGGMADDIWIHDFKTGATENLTNNPAQDICPMWGPDNKIYFISDRDGRMNLFVVDLASKETKQLTTFKDFDIKFPSIGKESIVFEEAGYIWRYDLKSGQATPLPIEIKEDLAIGRSTLVDASKHIESVNLAPDGERTIVVGRGDIFSVPAKEGTPRNLTKTSNAHERDAVWSPDGKWIAYNSDVTGENELYVRAQDGKGDAVQLTSGADTYYYTAKWSPDSKKLLWSDRLQRLRFVDVTTKTVTQVDQDKWGEIEIFNWSPDSQWIGWGRPEENGLPRVNLYSLANKQQTAVTDNWYGSGEPIFSDDGKYLLLSSARDFKPSFGDEEFANIYRDMERVYLVTLAKETENPLAPKSDEVGKAEQKREKEKAKEAEEKKPEEKAAGEKKPEEKKTEAAKPKKPVVVKVDTDGIQNRIVGLEITPGNYRNIRMVDDRIFYLRRTAGDDVGEDDDNDG